MCMAIYSPGDKAAVSHDVLTHCAAQNPHGMGLVYPSADGGLWRWRSIDLKDLPTLLALYDKAHEVGAPVMIHFRYQTHGKISVENAHPFFVPNTGKSLAFCHNGMIDIESSDEVSDTRSFGNHILAHLRPGWLDNMHVREMVEKAIGYSKLIFMDARARVDILNEQLGTWQDGVWFSNHGFRPGRKWYGSAWSDDDYETEYSRWVSRNGPAGSQYRDASIGGIGGTQADGDTRPPTVTAPTTDNAARRTLNNARRIGDLFGSTVAAMTIVSVGTMETATYCIGCCPVPSPTDDIYEYSDDEVERFAVVCDDCGEVPVSNKKWMDKQEARTKVVERRSSKRAKVSRKAKAPVAQVAETPLPTATDLDRFGYPVALPDDGAGATHFFRSVAGLYVYGQKGVETGVYCRKCCPSLAIGKGQTMAFVRLFDAADDWHDKTTARDRTCRVCHEPLRSLRERVDAARAAEAERQKEAAPNDSRDARQLALIDRRADRACTAETARDGHAAYCGKEEGHRGEHEGWHITQGPITWRDDETERAARLDRERGREVVDKLIREALPADHPSRDALTRDALGVETAQQAAEAAEARARAKALVVATQTPSQSPKSVAEVLLEAAAEQAAAHPETIA